MLHHALYMKAIHGGKAKDDDIDAEKIAPLLRIGNIPFAYVCPNGMRVSCDLLRRRNYTVHKRAELITHIQLSNAQYNLPPSAKSWSTPKTAPNCRWPSVSPIRRCVRASRSTWH